jgi:DNA polymerase-3 subunit chi
MPTDIDFYLLSCNSLDACGVFICRLIEKAYHQGHQLYIYTVSTQNTQKFNELLWTFRDTSFVPHPGPVQIGHSAPPPEYNDILVNLTPEAPSFYANFKRVLEIIANDATLKTAGRKKYKIYQRDGCKLKTHSINF